MRQGVAEVFGSLSVCWQNHVDRVNENEENGADSDLDMYNSCDEYSTDEDSDTESE